MKIIITSDLKAQKQEYEMIKSNESYDVHFDLGNSQFDLDYITRNSIITVKGPEDDNREAMEKRLIDLFNYTVYLTNGVKENVIYGTEMLEQKASEYNANIIIFPSNSKASCYKKDERYYIAVPRFSTTRKYILLDLNEEDNFNPIDNITEKELDITYND